MQTNDIYRKMCDLYGEVWLLKKMFTNDLTGGCHNEAKIKRQSIDWKPLRHLVSCETQNLIQDLNSGHLVHFL